MSNEVDMLTTIDQIIDMMKLDSTTNKISLKDCSEVLKGL